MIKPVSSSPARGSFQRDQYIKRCESSGAEASDALIRLFDDQVDHGGQFEQAPESRENNLEYDLRTTEWILEKVRADEVYAQHLYAAMCNNEFQPLSAWPILKDQRWSASWRYAGGIIADMQQRGDYIDWYCSGIANSTNLPDDEFREMSTEQQERYLQSKASVPEGTVTDEIRKDLNTLGWNVLDI